VFDRIAESLGAARDDLEEWCEGKRLTPRGVLLAYLIYAGVRHTADPLYQSWFGGITLGVHEIGHLVFAGFGRTLMILGGTIMQLLVPAAAGMYLLLRQRDHFGLAVCGGWLSYSMWGVATYVGDARREALPLVAFSDDAKHDWATLLTQWHVLNHADAFAAVIRVAAFGCWILSMALGAWVCYRIWRASVTAG
jgi:hypothetical protein